MEYARSFFPVILVVLLLRSFVVEPFRIPSGSMMPTLLVGDFILVNKFAYGLRWPVLNTKFLRLGEPQRGDVAVFRFPLEPGTDYIKRDRRGAWRRNFLSQQDPLCEWQAHDPDAGWHLHRRGRRGQYDGGADRRRATWAMSNIAF